jgi:hypothetical protein
MRQKLIAAAGAADFFSSGRNCTIIIAQFFQHS